MDHQQASDIIQRLVHGYPSHDYILDYQELREIGLKASLFPESDRPVVELLINELGTGDKIALFEPESRKSSAGVEGAQKVSLREQLRGAEQGVSKTEEAAIPG
jgi:hypothetical protein